MLANKMELARLFFRYLLIIIVTVLTLAGVIAAFNYFVNPFGVYSGPQISWVGDNKPHIYRNARMVKAHWITRAQARGLVLGSSRSDVGLHPATAVWPAKADPGFNASIPSARIYELLQYLRHANAEGNIRVLVLGLDFFMFDGNFVSERGFDESRLHIHGPLHRTLGAIQDTLRTLLSYDALEASFDTLRQQNTVAVAYHAYGAQNTRNRENTILRKGGYRAAFSAALRETVTSRDGIAALDYGPSVIEDNAPLNHFREIVDYCVSQQIELHIAISPVHALWLEAIARLGKWDDYERWKRDVVRVVESRRRDHATPKIEVWDFSGANSITREPIPQKDEPERAMTWYWEASHYKRETGDLMLRKMFGDRTEPHFAKFGVRLSGKNLDAHLQNIRIGMQQYRVSNKHSVALLESVLTALDAHIQTNRRL